MANRHGSTHDATGSERPHARRADITNCEDVQEASFRYDEPGEYTAVLIVRSRDGGSDLEREHVVVRPAD